MIDEDIKAALSPIVQGHVHPLRRPQRKDASAPEELPVIIYTIVSNDYEQAHTLCGPGLGAARVQFDCYARHYREARSIAFQAAAVLDDMGWRINMQPFPDDDERLCRWQLEYAVWRNEVPPP